MVHIWIDYDYDYDISIIWGEDFNNKQYLLTRNDHNRSYENINILTSSSDYILPIDDGLFIDQEDFEATDWTLEIYEANFDSDAEFVDFISEIIANAEIDESINGMVEDNILEYVGFLGEDNSTYEFYEEFPNNVKKGNWTINNKTVKSLTIGNKEVQSIVRVSDNKVLYEKPTNILAFGQSTYTASNGACTINCTLTLNCSVASGETVTLTGTDGSDYSATTDSNGVATFVLIGEGNITYTASFNNLSDSCLVNGMDNKIQIMKPTCSKSTRTVSSYRVQTLTWTVKDENGDVVPNVSGKFPFTYKSSSSSSTSYRSITATTDENGVTTYESICSGTSGTCYPSISCAVNGDSSHRPSVTGNWKYKSYTY